MAGCGGNNMTHRYARQMVLPEVGEAGQSRLAAASVAVVGAGGLGCAVLQYLCAAGVGHLTLIDPDRVEESNLHRQPLYRMSDLGMPKVQAAHRVLVDTNPRVSITAIAERVTPANASNVVGVADVVVDAADSLAVTYMLSDECRRTGKVLVSASVIGLSGYVGAFCGTGPSYRAVFPDMPSQVGSCAQSGVLGTAVGVIGTLQAHLILGLLLCLEPSPMWQLITVDFRTLRFGGFSFGGARERPEDKLEFISAADVSQSDIVVDLRSLQEAPVCAFASALRLGLDLFTSDSVSLPRAPRIVLCCRSGVRAWRAARALQRSGYSNLALIAFGE